MGWKMELSRAERRKWKLASIKIPTIIEIWRIWIRKLETDLKGFHEKSESEEKAKIEASSFY